MSKPLTLKLLQKAVADRAAAFRSRRNLQPAGGPGTKVFPPTFAGATYSVEMRRQQDPETKGWTDTPCVVLDTVQSQANRMEQALQEAIDGGRIVLPVVEVDFDAEAQKAAKTELLYPVGRITSLEAPHRLADAILRDSEHDGTPFRESAVGQPIAGASNQNATPLYELGPTTLVYGMWDSTGPRGGLGAKFERAIVSEIVGINCPEGFVTGDSNAPKARGIRRDPLNTSKQALVKKGKDGGWSNTDTAKGSSRPSEINHGNVPFDGDNVGVTIDYAEQTTTLSLIALRRLRFPDTKGGRTPERDAAAHAVLAALGLCGAALAADGGLDLRSRCLLWPETELTWELLARPGAEPEEFTLDAEAAVTLLKEAVAAAKKLGLTWRDEPVKLRPSAELVKLVARSQAFEAKNPTEGD